MRQRNIIRDKEVLKRTGLSDTTRWRLEGKAEFPKRVRLTEGGSVGWYEDEIDAWVHSRVRAGGKRPSKVAPAAERPPRSAKPRPSRNGEQPEPQPPAAA